VGRAPWPALPAAAEPSATRKARAARCGGGGVGAVLDAGAGACGREWRGRCVSFSTAMRFLQRERLLFRWSAVAAGRAGEQRTVVWLRERPSERE
jgi:hypothetical protein